jgi:hypothetical protein
MACSNFNKTGPKNGLRFLGIKFSAYYNFSLKTQELVPQKSCRKFVQCPKKYAFIDSKTLFVAQLVYS